VRRVVLVLGEGELMERVEWSKGGMKGEKWQKGKVFDILIGTSLFYFQVIHNSPNCDDSSVVSLRIQFCTVAKFIYGRLVIWSQSLAALASPSQSHAVPSYREHTAQAWSEPVCYGCAWRDDSTTANSFVRDCEKREERKRRSSSQSFSPSAVTVKMFSLPSISFQIQIQR
jgi:hypothetical protein